jgi:WD40 repeat protein
MSQPISQQSATTLTPLSLVELPSEVTQKIFILLPFEPALFCRLTCTRFRDIISPAEEPFWKALHQRLFAGPDSLGLEGKEFFTICKLEYIYRSNLQKGVYTIYDTEQNVPFGLDMCLCPAGKNGVAVGAERGAVRKIITGSSPSSVIPFLPPFALTNTVRSLVSSGTTVFAGYADGRVCAFDETRAGDQKQQTIAFGHTGSVTALASVCKDKQIVSGSFDKTIKVWDQKAAKCTAIFVMEGEVTAFAIAEQEFAVGFKDHGTIHVFQINMEKEPETLHSAPRYSLKGHAVGISQLVFDSKERRLISSAGKTIKLWDITTRKCTRTIENAHDHSILTLCFAASRVISLSYGSIKIWNPETGNATATIISNSNLPRGINLNRFCIFTAGKIFACGVGVVRCIDFTASRAKAPAQQEKKGEGDLAKAINAFLS